MYICRYAKPSKIGYACKYIDEMHKRDMDARLINSKPLIQMKPNCPSDVKRDERDNAICWRT